MSNESSSFDVLEAIGSACFKKGRQLEVITKRTLSSNVNLVNIKEVQEVFGHAESKFGLYF